jgi:hypothetical protein
MSDARVGLVESGALHSIRVCLCLSSQQRLAARECGDVAAEGGQGDECIMHDVTLHSGVREHAKHDRVDARLELRQRLRDRLPRDNRRSHRPRCRCEDRL